MNQIHQAADNLTWVRGSHSFKTGTDIQYNQAFGPNLPNDIFGIFNFSGFFTGSSYADFLLGYPLYSRRASYRGDADKHGTDMARLLPGFLASDAQADVGMGRAVRAPVRLSR